MINFRRSCPIFFSDNYRLLAEVGKRLRGKGERANKNPFPFNLFPFPALAKVTFARGLMYNI
ncbi:hypothetical protein VF03_03870 [Nostoc linckia z2]|jgi:hypothetical protein|nr:hypothetical protein VF05_06750 [Nostoc linckia z3]PHJ77787.1 hypothetical protein VF03_03870 [Nostoc linckia z2]